MIKLMQRMDESIKQKLKDALQGEVQDSEEVLEKFSRDASLFERKPAVVVAPKDIEDVKKLVQIVSENKAEYADLSITARSAGSDMTGGPLNDSIILSTTDHLNNFEVNEDELWATVQPGVFYRDFEKETLPEHITMPSYPASKRMAAMGGIVMNNSGGERSLRYGQTRDFVERVSMVLSDGNEYEFGPLNADELKDKMNQDDFEGSIYRQIVGLYEKNKESIEAAEPHVTKNSAGYALWRLWDKETDTFNMAQLFVGSQGTLGVMTNAKLRLLEDKKHSRLIVLFFKSWNDLPDVVNAVLPLDPESLETFDRDTMKLGIRFMPQIAKRAGESFLKFALRFLPEVVIGVRMLGMPKLVVLVEIAEDSLGELESKTRKVVQAVKPFRVWHRVLVHPEQANKYWTMRRESFSLLRQHVGDKRTAPFIEDFGIPPVEMPEFLPKALKILKDNGIKANIAGHAGNGNYHIIPLMNFDDPAERDKIIPVADQMYQLIVDHGGTITAEHNDGILRTPYLEAMYGKDIIDLFQQVKDILDPQNIFNPGKKVGGTKDDIAKYMVKGN